MKLSFRAELIIIALVIAMLGAVLFISFTAENKIETSYDVHRKTHMKTFLEALEEYAKDHQQFPSAISSLSQEISFSEANICDDLVPDYLPALPVDPLSGTYRNCSNYNTGYRININTAADKVTIQAQLSDGTTSSMSREA